MSYEHSVAVVSERFVRDGAQAMTAHDLKEVLRSENAIRALCTNESVLRQYAADILELFSFARDVASCAYTGATLPRVMIAVYALRYLLTEDNIIPSDGTEQGWEDDLQVLEHTRRLLTDDLRRYRESLSR